MEPKYMNWHLYSDINPYEVVKVHTEKRCSIRRMKAVITEESKRQLDLSFVPGGFAGHFDNGLQEWVIVSEPTNPEITVRLHKDGHWYSADGNKYIPDEKPVRFFDFNF